MILRSLAIASIAAVGSFTAAEAQTAVVINPQNTTSNLSVEELRRLYLGRSRGFDGGVNALLVEYATLKESFYDRILGLKPAVVRQRWIALLFRGEAATMPQEMEQASEVKRFVAANVGALAFLELSECDDTVKIVSIDGLRPGDADYRLQ